MRDEVKLGNLIAGEASRDAIHIAIAPVIAAESLVPGQHVGLNSEGEALAGAVHVGVVDPFLKSGPAKGQKFFLCLYPHTVTSLRHEWTHPSFSHADASPLSDMEYSERWLREYADRMNSYDPPDKAFALLLSGLRSGELFAHGSDLHDFYELDQSDELKEHAERYLGIKINWGTFSFSCSC